MYDIITYSVIISLHAHAQQGVKQLRFLSLGMSVRGTKEIEQLYYVVIHSEKGTITTFELFFEGHRANSVICDL